MRGRRGAVHAAPHHKVPIPEIDYLHLFTSHNQHIANVKAAGAADRQESRSGGNVPYQSAAGAIFIFVEHPGRAVPVPTFVVHEEAIAHERGSKAEAHRTQVKVWTALCV